MCLQIYEITDKCPNHKPDIHLGETQKQQLETKRRVKKNYYSARRTR